MSKDKLEGAELLEVAGGFDINPTPTGTTITPTHDLLGISVEDPQTKKMTHYTTQFDEHKSLLMLECDEKGVPIPNTTPKANIIASAFSRTYVWPNNYCQNAVYYAEGDI
jgi:hypothetical protein